MISPYLTVGVALYWKSSWAFLFRLKEKIMRDKKYLPAAKSEYPVRIKRPRMLLVSLIFSLFRSSRPCSVIVERDSFGTFGRNEVSIGDNEAEGSVQRGKNGGCQLDPRQIGPHNKSPRLLLETFFDGNLERRDTHSILPVLQQRKRRSTCFLFLSVHHVEFFETLLLLSFL